MKSSINQHLADNKAGERLRLGVKVALTGAPDVGKSSLLNFLCGEERAIVAAGPGTTRDVLTADAQLNGFPVVFIDTAGVRFGDHVSEVEREVSHGLMTIAVAGAAAYALHAHTLRFFLGFQK